MVAAEKQQQQARLSLAQREAGAPPDEELVRDVGRGAAATYYLLPTAFALDDDMTPLRLVLVVEECWQHWAHGRCCACVVACHPGGSCSAPTPRLPR